MNPEQWAQVEDLFHAAKRRKPEERSSLGRSYDVSRDGRRLFVVKQAEPDVRSRIHVLTNFAEVLTSKSE